MNYPIPTIRVCAEQAIPGCHFVHGEKEEQNIVVDQLTPTERVVLVEDKMLVTPTINKFGQRTTVTFQATVSVFAYSNINDDADTRLPRMNGLLTDAFALLAALEKHPALSKVVARNIVSSYNAFDANLDGVVMQLDLTPAERASLC
ncbi:hypothetical protein [Hymenobacter metallicola]|uniref:Uncharacterized protein n=1 Tax=Hymenobacter metallicola TaxID=2563114 RepID=A0A4Z0PYM1_9BACT|nr:hypothetical protein [Hymenobacter metallicola]TGE22817.1 hypothetical protein E5K02_20850 [Hymenobacter metallicola]